MFYAYILKSLKDHRYYYGSTSDLKKRLKSHNGGKVRSTKNRRPFELHYFEEFPTQSEALLRERFFKSPEGYAWLKENNII
ncbi:MAG: GIY-YIG nuclease family protein [Calditrichaceae bacterium]|nr:GIY-YIG nuclease family protein [Calditrichaceae bacterium]